MSSSSSLLDDIGFIGVLTIVFIVLKLCKVITWSWWWVLSPLWIGGTLTVAIIAFCILMAVITGQLKRKGRVCR